MKIVITIGSIVKEIMQAISAAGEDVWIGLLVRQAIKKPLREIIYGDCSHRPVAGLDTLAIVAWEFSNQCASKVVVPLLVQDVDGDCADSQLRAELRRLRRAAAALGMDVQAVLVGEEGIVEDWK